MTNHAPIHTQKQTGDTCFRLSGLQLSFPTAVPPHFPSFSSSLHAFTASHSSPATRRW